MVLVALKTKTLRLSLSQLTVSQRVQLFNAISIYQAPTLHFILHGNLGLPTETNKTSFENVHSRNKAFHLNAILTVNKFTFCCKYDFILTNKKLYACSQPCQSSLGKPQFACVFHLFSFVFCLLICLLYLLAIHVLLYCYSIICILFLFILFLYNVFALSCTIITFEY